MKDVFEYCYSSLKKEMSEAHVIFSKSSSACVDCQRQKAKWDSHALCILCRSCSQSSNCTICSSWSPDQWRKIRRATLDSKTPKSKQEMDPSHTDGSPQRDGSPDRSTGSISRADLKGILQEAMGEQQTVIQDLTARLEAIQSPPVPKVLSKNKLTGKGKTVGKKQIQQTLVPTDDVFDIDPSQSEFEDSTEEFTQANESVEDADDGSSSESESDHSSPLTTDNTHIPIMSDKGVIKVPYTTDPTGKISVAYGDRIALVAKIVGVKPTLVKASSPSPSFDYDDTSQEHESQSLLLPLAPAVGKTIHAFIKPLEKSSSARSQFFGKPQKQSFVCQAPDDFAIPPMPDKAINQLCKMEVVPDLPAAFNSPKMSSGQLLDLD